MPLLRDLRVDSSHCRAGGRLSENILPRVDRSDFRLPVVIYTSKVGVLRRPVESAVFRSLDRVE